MEKIKPMLAHDIDHFEGKPPWGSEAWTMETKFDGIRLLVRNEHAIPSTPRLFARSGNEHSGRYAFLDELTIPPHTVLDGELVVPGGQSSDASVLVNRGQLVYVIFDVLELAGHDLRGETYRQRREVMALNLFRRWERVSVVATHAADQDVAAALMEQGHEGVVLKRLDARYQEGRRSMDWLKMKKAFEVDVIIVDCDSPPNKGSLGDRNGWSCLSYGYMIDGKAVAVGSVGQSEPREIQEAKVGQVAVIKCNAINHESGALRHPRILRFRTDKLAEECELP